MSESACVREGRERETQQQRRERRTTTRASMVQPHPGYDDRGMSRFSLDLFHSFDILLHSFDILASFD